MSKIALTLDERELLELQSVILDDDAPAALEFLKTCIAAKIPTRGTMPCDSSRRNPYLQKPGG